MTNRALILVCFALIVGTCFRIAQSRNSESNPSPIARWAGKMITSPSGPAPHIVADSVPRKNEPSKMATDEPSSTYQSQDLARKNSLAQWLEKEADRTDEISTNPHEDLIRLRGTSKMLSRHGIAHLARMVVDPSLPADRRAVAAHILLLHGGDEVMVVLRDVLGNLMIPVRKGRHDEPAFEETLAVMIIDGMTHQMDAKKSAALLSSLQTKGNLNAVQNYISGLKKASDRGQLHAFQRGQNRVIRRIAMGNKTN